MVALHSTRVQAEICFHHGSFRQSLMAAGVQSLGIDRLALWLWSGTLPFTAVEFFLLLVL